VWFARTTADDDRPPLLIAAVLASVAATASGLLGVLVFSGQRVFFASALGAGVVVGFASLFSVLELVPCAYY
jgi:hypothetical protein